MGITAKIIQDDNPESPREWNNLGTMACWHRRYDLGDEQPDVSPEDYFEDLDVAVWVPLYLYDHGGITMNTTGFHCPWDSGQVGVIYVTRDKLIAEYGDDGPDSIENARRLLVSEVEVYDQYLRGDVYGFIIELDEEHEDSCFGFFGADPEENGMLDHVPDEHRQLLIDAYERGVEYPSW